MTTQTEHVKIVEKRPWCALTIVREEDFYLPKWYKYHSQFLDDRDIYVIHHITSNPDTCTDFIKDKVNILPEYNEVFSSLWLNKIVRKYHRQLLEKYEAVCFTEVDEILFTDPKVCPDLGAFMKSFLSQDEQTNVRCVSYTMMHLPDKEPGSFINDKNILDQRKYWYRYNYYDKPLISKVPLDWVLGFHTAPGMGPIVPCLYMIHFHQYDFDRYMERHTKYATKYKPDETDKAKGWNYHYRKVGAQLEHQYYHFYGTNQKIECTEVPEWVRTQVDL